MSLKATKNVLGRYLISMLWICALGSLSACDKSSPDKNISGDLGIPGPTRLESEVANETWIQTGVGEKELRSVAGQRCYNSQEEFMACVDGIAGFIEKASSHMRFGPTNYWESSPFEVKGVLSRTLIFLKQ